MRFLAERLTRHIEVAGICETQDRENSAYGERGSEKSTDEVRQIRRLVERAQLRAVGGGEGAKGIRARLRKN
jgi:hypothetical protein